MRVFVPLHANLHFDMRKIVSLFVFSFTFIVSSAQTEHNFTMAKTLDVFNALYRQLDLFYVDTLQADKVIGAGIEAMLEELDPYTVYYPEEDMGELKMMTTGKYGGIGSIIRMRKDSTVIIHEPYPDMPAAEVGLQVGDVLLKIDDKDLKGKTTSEVSELLRGEPGTTFVLKVQRPGEKNPRDFKITRRSIKKSAVPYVGLIEDAGYISLTEFTEGCSKEIRKAVISLKEKGAKSIILDLRGNGGGLLNEAVDIVNLFVPKGQTIVETKGKHIAAKYTYTTNNEPLDLEIPLAILVDATTASASEIVSGALQDLDRAIVVGTGTFGKGLVQSSRELPYNGSLKMTTAKYYIPSGRCIQKIDYKKMRDDAEIYRKTGKRPEKADSVKTVFHTAGGREVTEGSGIKPDVAVKHDSISPIVFYSLAAIGSVESRRVLASHSTLLYYLFDDDALIDWGTQYFQKHATIPSAKDLVITDQDFDDFKKMLKESDFKYDRVSEKRLEELKKTAQFEGYYEDAKPEFEALEKKLAHNLDREMEHYQSDIRRLMAQEVIKRYYYMAGKVEESIQGDEDIKAAIGVLHDQSEYKKILGKE